MKTFTAIILFFIPVDVWAQSKDIQGFCDFSYAWAMNPQGPKTSGATLEKIVVGKNFDRGTGMMAHFGLSFKNLTRVGSLGLTARYSGVLYFTSVDETIRLARNAFPHLRFTVIDRDWYLSSFQMGVIFSIPKKKWMFDMELLYGKSALYVPLLVIDGVQESKHYAYIRRLPETIFFTSLTPVLGFRRDLPENIYLFVKSEFSMGFGKGQELQYEIFPDKTSFEKSTPSNWSMIDRYYLPAIMVGVGGWLR